MIKKNIFTLMALISLCTVQAAAEPTKYPFTIENCGHSLRFAKSPKRVVSIGQNETETLYYLGLGDKVKATAFWFTPPLPQFVALNAKIPQISRNSPSFESVIHYQPDFVTNQYETVIGEGHGATGTYDQFNAFHIPVYTNPSICRARLAMDRSIKAHKQNAFSMKDIYQEVSDLAAIFNVNERGVELIKNMQAREDKLRAIAKNWPKGEISAFVWYSSTVAKLEPTVAGRTSSPQYIFDILGIKNIITVDQDWPTASWEYIAKQNPTLIILADTSVLKRPFNKVEDKLTYLHTDPVAKTMDAVVNNRILIMDSQALSNSIRTLDGLETIANTLIKMKLVPTP
ncbi:ABC transporter substrate-binding protein [Bartonella sp. DGB2]|uniref:ABC transporter substrate-binding protein n=1 Tax=Bartonella sp. DGB2 TaxID=3388426 RepID=UPI0039900D8C